jgi:micrococcal nuclease
MSIGVLLCGVVWVDKYHGGVVRQGISLGARLGLDGWRYHEREFEVVNVVDGDTLDIGTRVRLLGVDTPETKSPKVAEMYYGPQATEYVSGLAEGKRVTIILDTVGDVRDLYGRLLGYVRMADGRILNEEIVSEGFGYADLRFAHKDYDKYVQLQDEAIAAGKGLWKEVRRDQLPKWLQRERADLPTQTDGHQ